MVRLADLPEIDAKHLLDKDCPSYETAPFVSGPPLAKRRVAIVTTAGLHRRDQPTFSFTDTGYRVLPGDVTGNDLVMSHSSVNYDRSGFMQDVNVVFPIDRLRQLERESVIGSLASYHYSLMGAHWEPNEIEKTARQVAGLLKQDQVDAALLVPV